MVSRTNDLYISGKFYHEYGMSQLVSGTNGLYVSWKVLKARPCLLVELRGHDGGGGVGRLRGSGLRRGLRLARCRRLGPDTYGSPRHRMASSLVNEGSICVR